MAGGVTLLAATFPIGFESSQLFQGSTWHPATELLPSTLQAERKELFFDAVLKSDFCSARINFRFFRTFRVFPENGWKSFPPQKTKDKTYSELPNYTIHIWKNLCCFHARRRADTSRNLPPKIREVWTCGTGDGKEELVVVDEVKLIAPGLPRFVKLKFDQQVQMIVRSIEVKELIVEPVVVLVKSWYLSYICSCWVTLVDGFERHWSYWYILHRWYAAIAETTCFLKLKLETWTAAVGSQCFNL